jgi:thermitase
MFHGRIISAVSAITFLMLSSAHAVASDRALEAVPGEFVVKFKPGFAITSEKLGAVGVEGMRLVSPKQNLMLVKSNRLLRADFALQDLKKLPQVEIAEPNFIYHIVRTPNDPDFSKLWGMFNDGKAGGRAGVDIGAEQAWDIETGSDKVTVAVIDTGIDYTHPDLQQNVWVNQAELNGKAGVDDDADGFVDDIYGYDFVNNDGDPMDDHGHGSHCSGTIGARGDDGKGIVGVNWNVKIMALKFLDHKGSGNLADAIKAIDFATAKGVDVMSNSWGGGQYSQLLEESIKRARDKGILFVVAAGNDSNDNDKLPSYPAAYNVDNVLAVAAIDHSGQLASFSNHGTTTVQIAAPGVDVYSSIPGGYDSWSGTSMATPHVSGVAALVKAHEPNISYADLKTRLIDTSRPLGSLRGKVSSMGVVNAYLALTNQKAPLDPLDPFYWTNDNHAQSSPHPYAPNARSVFAVSSPGAKRISAYFDKFQTENQYDLVRFKDATGKVVGEWSGTHDGEYSPVVEGETLTIELMSDNSVQKYGFDISKVAYQ